MMKKRLFICSVMMIICFLFSSVSVYATNIKDIEQKKKEADAKAADAKANLSTTRTLKNNAQIELEAIETELAIASEQLDSITFELENKRLELEEAEEDLDKTRQARDRQFESFKERSRYIYMNGSMSYVDAILSAKSVTDLVKRIDYVNRIVEYDKTLVKQLKESEELITVQVEKAQKQKDDHEVLLLLQTEKTHKYEEAVLQKELIINQLEQDEVTYLQSLEQWDSASKDFEKQIKAYQEEERRKAVAAGQQNVVVYQPDGNPLQWPLPGKTTISSPYGNRKSPISGKAEFHTGVDVPAAYGTSILAAESGTVIYSGWQNGYGNTVVVDHGNGMTTLYAHASSLVVRVGQSVSRGQVLSKVGSTGWSTGNHLHFEVRVSGAHTNPMKYTQAR